MVLIRGFLRELRRKRYAKAFRRFTGIKARKLDLLGEGIELLTQEMSDKDLYRDNYYEENEPNEFVSTYLPISHLNCDAFITDNFIPSVENTIDESPPGSCASKV